MGLSQSYGTGGSSNSASNWSTSGSQTLAGPANSTAQSAASLAYARQQELNRQTMAFNAAEAQKQREWEEQMANTIYTRSVKNMKEAGINPILAANMGLSAASVGSGATASFGGSSAPMANTFMDSVSSGQSAGKSHGSSWQNSEAGLITFAQTFANALNGMVDTANSSAVTEELTEKATEALNALEGQVANGENEEPNGEKYYPNWERFKRKVGNIKSGLESLLDLGAGLGINSNIMLSPIGKNNKSKNTYSA